jgi:hypothetical protein
LRSACARIRGQHFDATGADAGAADVFGGFWHDYVRAQRLQTQLNAISDAAALAAVDPAMLCQSSASANAAATGMFNAQSGTLQGLASITPTITINPSNSPAGCAARCARQRLPTPPRCATCFPAFWARKR